MIKVKVKLFLYMSGRNMGSRISKSEVVPVHVRKEYGTLHT